MTANLLRTILILATALTALPAAAQSTSGRFQTIYIPLAAKIKVTDRSKDAGQAVRVQATDTSVALSLSGKTNGGKTVSSLAAPLAFQEDSVVGPVYTANGPCNMLALLTCQGLILSTGPESAPLEYSNFFMTNTADNRRGRFIGAGYSGAITPVASIPKNVTATYTGTFLGQYVTTEKSLQTTQIGVLTGTTTLRADFGKARVTGQITNLREIDEDLVEGSRPLEQGLALNAKIKGNTYAGTASFRNANGGATGRVTHSAVNGQFNGPGAAETSGAVRAEGKLVVTSNGKPLSRTIDSIAIVGGFGAKANR